MQNKIFSFDGTESAEVEVLRPDRLRHLEEIASYGRPTIPRGAGLSYCLASAGAGCRSVLTERFDRILSFDETSGLLHVESGITLGALYRFSVPRGWILPVMPGHPSISLGGCLAFDVHGKNQFREGNFGAHVEELTVLHPKTGPVRCSAAENADLYHLTLGGMGLTGFVLQARLRLRRVESDWFLRRRIEVGDLEEAMRVMTQFAGEADSLYSWNDLNDADFGRGFVYVARGAGRTDPGEIFEVPRLDSQGRRAWGISALNRFTTRPALAAFARSERRKPSEENLGLFESCFPVASRGFYFKLFGRRGFREYQFLAPSGAWGEISTRLRTLVRRENAPVSLASLKCFRGAPRNLGFGGDGFCLALDLPEGDTAHRFFSALDDLVRSVGGRVNVAKDSRLSAEVARAIFPEYEAFRERLHAFDPDRRYDSLLRKRLEL